MSKRSKRRDEAAVRVLLSGLEVTDGFETGRHGRIPVRSYRVRGSEPARTLVWLHGGAFSYGGLDQNESHALAAAVAQTGAEVAVDYRLVPPANPFKDAPPGPSPGIRFRCLWVARVLARVSLPQPPSGLRRQGTRVEYDVVPESRHGFLDRPASPAFARATAWIGEFLAA